MCFFSCRRIISHDRIYVERMFWGPPDRFSSPTEKIIAKTIIRICPFRQILSCSNLPTSSVELIWPMTELYFRQILSTDFMNRFCQDVKTGPQVDSYRFWSWGYTQFWQGRSLVKEVGRNFDFEKFHPTTNAATSCLRHVTDIKTQIFSFCTADRKMGRSPCPFVYVPTDNPQARYKYGEDVCIISATGLCDYSMTLKTFIWALLHRCVLWYIVADVLLLDYTLLLFRDGPFRVSYASTIIVHTLPHGIKLRANLHQ